MSKSGRGDRGVAASALPVPLDLTRGRQREAGSTSEKETPGFLVYFLFFLSPSSFGLGRYL